MSAHSSSISFFELLSVDVSEAGTGTGSKGSGYLRKFYVTYCIPVIFRFQLTPFIHAHPASHSRSCSPFSYSFSISVYCVLSCFLTLFQFPPRFRLLTTTMTMRRMSLGPVAVAHLFSTPL